MKKWQKDILRRKGPELLNVIDCNITLLRWLNAKGFLITTEVRELASIQSPASKTDKLLDWLESKVGGYEALVEALESSNQTEAVSLLQCPSTSIRRYKHLSDELEEFVEEKCAPNQLKILLVSTIDCEITTDKIRENLDTPFKLQKMDEDTRVKFTGNDVQIITHVTSIDELLPGLKRFFGSVVVITELNENEAKEALDKLQKPMTLQVITDNIKWTHITKKFKAKLLQRKITWQKGERTLEEVLGMAGDGTKLEEEIEGSLLLNIINNKKPPLLGCNLPVQLKYYIPRRVRTREVVSLSILKECTADIFLFAGIERYQLSSLLDKKATDTSINQIRDGTISVKFVLLDLKSDFEKIVKLTHNPVHLLHYNKANKNFVWVRSSGSVAIIQKNLVKKQNEYNENEFINLLESKNEKFSCLHPVCLSDSPGMGKSTLLATFGNNILEKCPARVVIFIELGEFLPSLKNLSDFSEDNIMQVITSYIAVCKLGQNILLSGIKEGKLIASILFDGLDEVWEEKKLVFQAITKLLSRFKNSLQIFVSTRPHLLEELETTLHVMGYTIPPFKVEDQIQFLTSYWSHSLQLDTEKLTPFASNCVSHLSKSLKEEDKEISGVPLQCLLIAQVYEEDALTYSEPKNTMNVSHTPDLEPITSLVHLYKRMVQKKIEIFDKRHPGKINETALMLA